MTIFILFWGFSRKRSAIQTRKLLESNLITLVSQVGAWGNFGQCLINSKTKFRASSIDSDHLPSYSFISGVWALPLSTSLLFLIASLRKSVQTPLGIVASLVSSLCRQAPSLLLSFQGRRLKTNPPKSAFGWTLLRTTLKSICQAQLILCCWYWFVFFFFFERRLTHKAFQKISKRIWYNRKDLFGFY